MTRATGLDLDEIMRRVQARGDGRKFRTLEQMDADGLVEAIDALREQVATLTDGLAYWKSLLARRTETLRDRAERAERERDHLRVVAQTVRDSIELGRSVNASLAASIHRDLSAALLASHGDGTRQEDEGN